MTYSRLDQLALVAALSFALAGCAKQTPPEASGAQDPASSEPNPNPELPAESEGPAAPSGAETAKTQAPADVSMTWHVHGMWAASAPSEW